MGLQQDRLSSASAGEECSMSDRRDEGGVASGRKEEEEEEEEEGFPEEVPCSQ